MPPEHRRRACRKTLQALFLHDEEIRRKHPVVAGLDEAGRGPLAGPVVAAAVVLPPGIVIEGLRDSKKIAEKQRKEVFWNIVRHAAAVGVGMVSAEEIDRLNILRSTKRAMELAVDDLGIRPDILLIDALGLPHIDIEQHSIIRGESASASIAAASVVAKVVRDDIMIDCHVKYPAYNFKAHKGYSTIEHMELIRVHGPCPIHRKSFSRVTDVQLPLGYEP